MPQKSQVLFEQPFVHLDDQAVGLAGGRMTAPWYRMSTCSMGARPARPGGRRDRHVRFMFDLLSVVDVYLLSKYARSEPPAVTETGAEPALVY